MHYTYIAPEWDDDDEKGESIEDIIKDMFPEGVDDGFNWAGD